VPPKNVRTRVPKLLPPASHSSATPQAAHSPQRPARPPPHCILQIVGFTRVITSWRRLHRRSVPVLVVTLLAALQLLSASCTRQNGNNAQPAPPPQTGVQFHGLWSDYTDDKRNQVLDQFAAAHIGWVRLDVSWAMLQPDNKTTISPWGEQFVDRVIRMAEQRRLRILVTFWLTPAWANGGAGERALPRDPGDYARAIEWATQRWANRVSAWEIWNEPNHEEFLVGTDPVAYTALLRAAYPAVHRGDPNAKVVFGGTVYNDDGWISNAYAAGAKGNFDIMATHPYQAVADQPPETPDNGSTWRLTHVTAVRNLMVHNGDGDKEIWFTEFGWSSHSNSHGIADWQRGVTRAQQADYLIRTLKLVSSRYSYVTHVFWYTDRDGTADDAQNANYGLLTADSAPKPAYTALRDYLKPRQR
jgi:beta-xylosidase